MHKYNEDDFTMQRNPKDYDEEQEEPSEKQDPSDDIPEDVQGAISAKSAKLFRNKVKQAQLDDAIKKIEKVNSIIEKEIGDLLEALDIESFKTGYGSHTRKEHMYVKVDDFDAFWNWVVKSGATEFISKTVNVRPFRTMLNKENKVPPGLSPNPQVKTESRINPSFKSEELAKLNKEN